MVPGASAMNVNSFGGGRPSNLGVHHVAAKKLRGALLDEFTDYSSNDLARVDDAALCIRGDHGRLARATADGCDEIQRVAALGRQRRNGGMTIPIQCEHDSP